jgi:hypothetical protein
MRERDEFPCHSAREVYDRGTMNDRRDDRGSDHPRHHDHGHDGPDRREDRSAGPVDTAFLNLEMSKVILSEAQALATEVGRELLREAIRERLKERLGDRLRAVGHLVADALADDLEANLAIESKIEEHRAARKGLDERVRDALSGAKRNDPAPG